MPLKRSTSFTMPLVLDSLRTYPVLWLFSHWELHLCEIVPYKRQDRVREQKVEQEEKINHGPNSFSPSFFCVGTTQEWNCLSGTKDIRHSTKRLYSGGGGQIHALLGPLWFQVLNPNHTPKVKCSKTVLLGALTAHTILWRLPELCGLWDTLSADQRVGWHHIPLQHLQQQLQRATLQPQWRQEPLTPNPIPLCLATAYLMGQDWLWASAAGIYSRRLVKVVPAYTKGTWRVLQNITWSSGGSRTSPTFFFPFFVFFLSLFINLERKRAYKRGVYKEREGERES